MNLEWGVGKRIGCGHNAFFLWSMNSFLNFVLFIFFSRFHTIFFTKFQFSVTFFYSVHSQSWPSLDTS
jgi:hypothetical protein